MKIKLISFLFFSTLIVAACNSTSKVAVPNTAASSKSGKQLSEDELIRLKYLFVEANKEKLLGNMGKAAELFAQCIRIDGSNSAAMFELAQIYREQKKINDALFFAKSAHEIDRKNVWYRLFLGDLLINAKKSNEAEKVFEDLFKDHPRNVDYAFKYASSLLYNGKLAEAIKVYDQVEAEIGITQELSMEKERLWLKLGKVDKAAEEVEKLIARDPKELRNYSLLVELYQVNNQPEQAREVITRMEAIDPSSPFVYLALAEYYRSQNQKEKSFEQLKLAFGSKDLELELKIKIIASYLPLVEDSPEMLEQGVTLSAILAETHPGEAIPHAINGDFQVIKKDYAAARDAYMKSVQFENKDFTIWQKLIICQVQLNDFDGMVKSSEEALSLFPDQSVVYLYSGIGLSNTKRNQEAVKILLAGSKLVVDDDDQLRQFYTNLADNYNTLKNFEESDKYFEKALKLNPRDPLVLNNYSYYLSVRNVNLEKAEVMSRESNEIQPGQPSYQDTYGWILFMMGKYEESKVWLQKAIDSGGADNGTILEHMGDVMSKLGNIEKAVELWKQAKEKGDTTDLIDRKIAEKKFYE